MVVDFSAWWIQSTLVLDELKEIYETGNMFA